MHRDGRPQIRAGDTSLDGLVYSRLRYSPSTSQQPIIRASAHRWRTTRHMADEHIVRVDCGENRYDRRRA